MEFNKKAKATLKDFLEAVPKMDKNRLFKFRLFKHDKTESAVYVHRMRVELSRWRTIIKEQGEVIKAFKILLIDIKAEGQDSIITLRYKDADNQILSAELTSLFSSLSDGKQHINIGRQIKPVKEKGGKLRVKVN